MVEHQANKSAIYILVWRDFGAGELSYDPKWQKQVRSEPKNESSQHAFENRYFYPPHTTGRIRCAFELQGNTRQPRLSRNGVHQLSHSVGNVDGWNIAIFKDIGNIRSKLSYQALLPAQHAWKAYPTKV